MSSTPEPQYPTEAEITKWLNELDARQRMALRLYLVKNFKQTEAAIKLGMTQGTFSPYYNKVIESLNRKAKSAGRAFPISNTAITSALEKIPESLQEQAELVSGAIAGTRDEVVNNQKTQTQSGGLDEIQKNTAAQPTEAEPLPVLRTWGIPIAALIVGLILGAIAMLSRGGGEGEVVLATVVVPETVVVTEEVAVRETVPVPQTVVVPQTVPALQTVVVRETSVVTVTQLVTVTELPQQSNIEAAVNPNEVITALPTVSETTNPAAGSSATTTGVLFSDDFDAGPSSAWVIDSGDWNMRNGWLVNTGRRGFIWLGPQNWTDVAVEFDVARTFCSGSIQVLIRVQDPNNYVGYEVIGCNSERVYLVKDGKVVKDIVFTYSTAGRHRLEVKGNIYRVYQNGVSVGSGSDSTYSQGSVGIIVDGASQQIDNFKVSELK
jgi:hypothetical protein